MQMNHYSIDDIMNIFNIQDDKGMNFFLESLCKNICETKKESEDEWEQYMPIIIPMLYHEIDIHLSKNGYH